LRPQLQRAAVAGVEPQSETVWNQAERHGVPRLAFVKKMHQGPRRQFAYCAGQSHSRPTDLRSLSWSVSNPLEC